MLSLSRTLNQINETPKQELEPKTAMKSQCTQIHKKHKTSWVDVAREPSVTLNVGVLNAGCSSLLVFVQDFPSYLGYGYFSFIKLITLLFMNVL